MGADANTLIRDLMTEDVVTLHRNDKLNIAEDIMTLGRIRHLPVLDEDEQLCGLLSQRDLLHGALAGVLGYGQAGRRKLGESVLVKEVMSPHPTTISPDAPLSAAAQEMTRLKIGCLPVVDDKGALVGIITESDFVLLHVPGEKATE